MILLTSIPHLLPFGIHSSPRRQPFTKSFVCNEFIESTVYHVTITRLPCLWSWKKLLSCEWNHLDGLSKIYRAELSICLFITLLKAVLTLNMRIPILSVWRFRWKLLESLLIFYLTKSDKIQLCKVGLHM